ncbi:MAG: hypothetical protein ABFS35_12855 [Bacteroidota bacterium]
MRPLKLQRSNSKLYVVGSNQNKESVIKDEIGEAPYNFITEHAEINNPVKTNFKYMTIALYSIIIRGKRSK